MTEATTAPPGTTAPSAAPDPAAAPGTANLRAMLEESGVQDVLNTLDAELVGLEPVKTRLREIAAYLVVERARLDLGLTSTRPVLHMAFVGNPGTGKTTVALRMASILHRLGYIRRDHLVVAARDDLVGQYIGHTAPKTKEILKKAMGGVLFIDEAYALHRAENERDYGQEAVELLLQVMENKREDLVVIVAGYEHRMAEFFNLNPGMRSRIAHHLHFPDYGLDELEHIAGLMLEQQDYRLGEGAAQALRAYLACRSQLPEFANARSVRNGIDRFKLRQAGRLVQEDAVSAADLQTIAADDILRSRVFEQCAAASAGRDPTPAKE